MYRSSSFHHFIRNGLLLITLSLLLLISEGLYRYFFAVQMTAKNLTEELFLYSFLYQFLHLQNLRLLELS